MKRKLWLSAMAVVLACVAVSAARGTGLEDLLNTVQQVAPLAIADDQIGALFSEGLEKQYGLDQDPQRNARVRTIGGKILAANGLKTKYDFAVLATHDFNACSIYGGRIRVNEGLLYDTQNNDAEAAFAIGHEIAHSELGHNKESVRTFRVSYALDLAHVTDKAPKLMLAAANAALAKRSRKNESAADEKALEYMQRAGYKTTGAIAMCRRIEAEHKIAQRQSGSQSLLGRRFDTIFDTHPEPAKRAEAAEDFYLQSRYGTTFRQVKGASSAAIADRFDWPVGPITGRGGTNGVSLERSGFAAGGWHIGDGVDSNADGVTDGGYGDTSYTGVAHNGADLNWGSGASDEGQPVYAIANGVVRAVLPPDAKPAWRGVVLVEHTLPDGQRVASQTAHLGHIEDEMRVGEPVRAHQLLGTIGPTPAKSKSPHVHFEMRDDLAKAIGTDPYNANQAGWVDPLDFIARHRTLASGHSGADRVAIIRPQFHLGDDVSQTEMVKDAAFSFGKSDATLTMWIKGSPFKDPIIWINRREVGRVVTTDDRWHQFSFQVPAEYLNEGRNLLLMESFIPDRRHTFDDCEVKEVWIKRN